MPQIDRPRRVSVGVAGLDDVLHGGLIRDRLYLLHGEPGAGKTTLALQFLLAGLAQGERCLYVTLSETAAELRDGAASHGWSLDGIDIVELIAEEIQLEGDGDLTMYHPSEVDFTRTTQRVLEAVERARPQRMVLDSLSEMRLLAQSSLRYRRQIMAIKQYFIDRGCTVLLLDDRTADGPDSQLQSLAHGVIALEHRSPVYGAVLRQIEVAKLRGSAFRSGRHDMAIAGDGIRVYPRLTANEHATEHPGEPLSSGVPALDALLGGGVDRGTTTLLIGPAGAGKSTVALLHAASVAARGGHAEVFLFEEARAVMLTRLRGMGIVLREGTGPGEVAIRQLDPAEVSPGEFAALVRRGVEERGCQLVVLDSLNGYLNAMPSNRELAMQLHELLAYLHNSGVTTFLVASQIGLIGTTMQSPIDASYLADNIIVFRFFEHHSQLGRAIAVVKKRTGSHERTIRELTFDAAGVHVGQPLLGLRGVFSGVPTESLVQPGDLARSANAV